MFNGTQLRQFTNSGQQPIPSSGFDNGGASTSQMSPPPANSGMNMNSNNSADDMFCTSCGVAKHGKFCMDCGSQLVINPALTPATPAYDQMQNQVDPPYSQEPYPQENGDTNNYFGNGQHGGDNNFSPCGNGNFGNGNNFASNGNGNHFTHNQDAEQFGNGNGNFAGNGSAGNGNEFQPTSPSYGGNSLLPTEDFQFQNTSDDLEPVASGVGSALQNAIHRREVEQGGLYGEDRCVSSRAKKMRDPPPYREHNPNATKLIPLVRKGELPKVRRALLNQDFNFDEVDENNCTPIHHAVEATRNEEKLMEVLLEHGFSPDHSNVFGAHPLHYVCFRKNRWSAIAQILIDYGATVNSQTAELQTPLHSACRHAIVELVTTLLESHADPSICDHTGGNALHATLEAGGKDHLLQDISSQLLQTHANLITPERSGPLHSIENNEGWWPVHLGANKGLLSVVHFLIESSANPEICTSTKMNSIHCAAASGSFDMLNYLIGKMPSHCVRSLDARGNTPLHHAVQRDSRECANLLLRNGASSRVRNNARQTPLDMVRQFQGITPHANLGKIGSPELVQLLKEHMEKSGP